jgi:hypothetical protein
MDLRALLIGKDRRSVARAKDALQWLRADRNRIDQLIRLTTDTDWLIVMRAMDLLEKLAHEKPEWIQPHRNVLIGPLAEHDSWEIRLQIARALPLLNWPAAEKSRAVSILEGYTADTQKFVKAWALDSLAQFAMHDVALMPKVEKLLTQFEHSGSKSLLARARRIREFLAHRLTGQRA